MPTYRVTDPTTGKSLKLTGDSPPTEQELEGIFSQVHGQAAPAPEAAANEQPGLIKRAVMAGLGPVGYVGTQLDRVTGVPLRAAISAAQDVATSDLDTPTYQQVPRGLMKAGQAFIQNFGSQPSEVPDSKSLAQRSGVSLTQLSDKFPGAYSESGEGIALKQGGFLDPTMAGMAGLALDIGTPVPLGPAAKIAGKVGVPVARVTGKVTAKAAGIAGETAARSADILTGTKAGTKTLGAMKSGVKGVEKGFDALGKTISARFGTNVAPDFAKSLETAKRNGINPDLLPEAVVFGPKKSVTSLALHKAEGPLGEPLKEKHAAGLQAVRDAIDTDIRKIGGEPLNQIDAGGAIRTAYDEGVKRVFDEATVTHDAVVKLFPGLKIAPNQMEKINSALNGIEKFAVGRVRRGVDPVQRAQGQYLLNAVSAIREGNGSYKQTVEALKDIGESAFQSKNNLAAIPTDKIRMRQLYNTLREGLVKSIPDKKLASELVENNKKLHDFFGDKSILDPIIGQVGRSDESVFKSLIENGDSKKIAALKKVLSPEAIQQAKSSLLNSLIKTDSEGNFTFKSLNNALRQKNNVVLALFEPGEIDNLRDLVQLGDKFGSDVLSRSGTGASLSFQNLVFDKPLQVADRLMNEGIAAKANASKARAIGFQTDEPLRSAARNTPPPTILGLGPQGSATLRQLYEQPKRAKLSQVYSTQSRQEEK